MVLSRCKCTANTTENYVNVHKIHVNRSLFSGHRSVKAINFLVISAYFGVFFFSRTKKCYVRKAENAVTRLPFARRDCHLCERWCLSPYETNDLQFAGFSNRCADGTHYAHTRWYAFINVLVCLLWRLNAIVT